MKRTEESRRCGTPEDPLHWSYVCTRRRGHAGDHIARGYSMRDVLARWSR